MFVVVEVDGTETPDPSLVALIPGRDLRVFGPFDTPDLAAQWIIQNERSQEKNVILRLEWHL